MLDISNNSCGTGSLSLFKTGNSCDVYLGRDTLNTQFKCAIADRNIFDQKLTIDLKNSLDGMGLVGPIIGTVDRA